MLQITPGSIITDGSRAVPDVDARIRPRDVVSMWRRYRTFLVACVLAALALGGLYVMTTAPSFNTFSQVLIESRRGTWSGAGAEVSYAQYSLDSSQIESQIQIVRSEQIARRVVQGLKLETDSELNGPDRSIVSRLRGLFASSVAPPPPSNTDAETIAVRALSERVQVRRLGQSYVIEISYSSGDPIKAAKICNSVTAAYVSDLLQNKINGAEAGGEILQRRISSLREQREAAEQAIAMGTFASVSFPSADARVITTAFPSSAQSWPRPSLVLLFSGTVGLFVALLGMAAHRSLDRSIRSKVQLEQDLGLEPLGSLPRARSFQPHHRINEVAKRPVSQFSREIQQIKTSVQLLQSDSHVVCIGLVSTSDSEGLEVLASNLAFALAGAGSRVLLVDANLRDPRATRLWAPESRLGLLDLLAGRATYTDVIVLGAPGTPDFIPSVVEEQASSSLDILRSERMGDLLKSCRKLYSAIIVVLPALEESPDARATAIHLDGVICTVGYGRLAADRIDTSLRSLRLANVRLLGAVLTEQPV